MKLASTDKVLVGIVVGIVLLVAATFAVVLIQPAPSYRTDDTPEAVMHSYMFAVTNNDMPRAYGLLSKNMPGYPTEAQFNRHVSNGRDSASLAWQVGTGRTEGEEVVVPVALTTFISGGLFWSGETQEKSEFRLVREDGAWRIASGESYRFWRYCWDRDDDCD